MYSSPSHDAGRIYTPRTALGHESRRSPSRSLGRAVSQPMTGHHDKVFPYTRKVWDPTEVDRYDSLIRQELRKEDDLLGMMDLDEHRRRAREETRNLTSALRYRPDGTEFYLASERSPQNNADYALPETSKAELESVHIAADRAKAVEAIQCFHRYILALADVDARRETGKV